MFTGLIRALGRVVAVEGFGGGKRLAIDLAPLGDPFPAPGASVAVNGVCLTVTGRRPAARVATFDAVAETVSRSNLALLVPGARVNLEPALRLGDPLDGHLVLGHVDALSTLLEVTRKPESVVLRFSLPGAVAGLVAAKGSVALDGISLTVVAAGSTDFTVSIIPATLRDTTLSDRAPGAAVNLEADVLARYAARALAFAATPEPGENPGPLTAERLRAAGFP